jgi:prophage antirepressor-like protein
MLLAEFNFEETPLQFYKAPNGEIVVSASSLIRALKGNANNAALIARNNVREKWIIDLPLPSGGKPVVCLFEPGAFQLAANSMFQTDLAERFQDWLFEEILPKLRADRFVSLPGMDQLQINRARRELDQRETQFRLLKAEVQELKEANKLYQGQIRVKSAEWMTIEAFLRRYKFQMVNYHGEVHTKDYVRCKMYFKESMQQISRHFCHSEIVDRFDWLWDDFALFPKEQVMDWLYNPSIYEKFPRRFLFALMESNLLGWGLSQYTDFRFVEREPLQGWLAQRQER